MKTEEFQLDTGGAVFGEVVARPPRNIITVATFRRPFHTRLCLEATARAQRWSGRWANLIAVCVPCNAHEHPDVAVEIQGVIDRNPDVPFVIWHEDCPSDPHAASKWMLDKAFAAGAEIALYVEDDAVLAVDALLMCEFVKRMTDKEHPAYGFYGLYGPYGTAGMKGDVLGCCLYHETIPAQYIAEGRIDGPDARLLHLSNGLNTCGGTAFLRQPYLDYLSPNWNCKQVEPRGFDYSAHYLMYLHGLYMVWPDLSRSFNIGFTSGSISQSEWAKYFGRSIWTQTKDAARVWYDFRMDGIVPATVREPWMGTELLHRGLLP